MGLIQSDTAEVCVPEEPGVSAERILPTYDVAISLQANPKFSYELEAVGAVLANRSALVLIGRNILDRCRFVYDGEGGGLLCGSRGPTIIGPESRVKHP